MFEQSLVETGHTLEARQPASLLASLAAQIAVVSLLVLIPLLRSAVMPGGAQNAPVTVPLDQAAPRLASAAAARPSPARLAASRVVAQFAPPLPPLPQLAIVTPAAPPVWLSNGGAGVSSAVPAVNIPLPAMPPPPASAPDQPLPVGGDIEAARCLACPPPAYPAFARQARLQGTVELQAEISPAGAVAALRRLSGNALLAAAAERAVRAWRYQPLLLDGRAVAVTTVITVRFRLQ